MYFIGKRLIGRWAGGLPAVLFIASPLLQESSARVMTEHLVTLEMAVATLFFARFVGTEQVGNAFTFGAVAAVAILTHGPGPRWRPSGPRSLRWRLRRPSGRYRESLHGAADTLRRSFSPQPAPMRSDGALALAFRRRLSASV
jgi:hypothetical protein